MRDIVLVILLLVSICLRSSLSAPLKTRRHVNGKHGKTESDMPGLLRHKRDSIAGGTMGHVEEALYQSRRAFIQKGQTHHIRCPSLRQREVYSAVFWLKGPEDVLLVRFITMKGAANFTLSDRYRISDSHGLIIKNVVADDDDGYVCRGVTKITGHVRVGRVTITVLDKDFPRESGSTSSIHKTINITQGDKQTIGCPATSPSSAHGVKLDRATVYWSLDVGQDDYTKIIGARYSNGDIVVINDYHGNLTVAESGSLVVGSMWNDKRGLWCHLSVEGSGIVYGYVDINRKEKAFVVTTQPAEISTTEFSTATVRTNHIGSPALQIADRPPEHARSSVVETLILCVCTGMLVTGIAIWMVKHRRKSCLSFRVNTKTDRGTCMTPMKKDEVEPTRPPPSNTVSTSEVITLGQPESHFEMPWSYKTSESTVVRVVEVCLNNNSSDQKKRALQANSDKVMVDVHQNRLKSSSSTKGQQSDCESGDLAEKESLLPQRDEPEGKAASGDDFAEKDLLLSRKIGAEDETDSDLPSSCKPTSTIQDENSQSLSGDEACSS